MGSEAGGRRRDLWVCVVIGGSGNSGLHEFQEYGHRALGFSFGATMTMGRRRVHLKRGFQEHVAVHRRVFF